MSWKTKASLAGASYEMALDFLRPVTSSRTPGSLELGEKMWQGAFLPFQYMCGVEMLPVISPLILSVNRFISNIISELSFLPRPLFYKGVIFWGNLLRFTESQRTKN